MALLDKNTTDITKEWLADMVARPLPPMPSLHLNKYAQTLPFRAEFINVTDTHLSDMILGTSMYLQGLKGTYLGPNPVPGTVRAKCNTPEEITKYVWLYRHIMLTVQFDDAVLAYIKKYYTIDIAKKEMHAKYHFYKDDPPQWYKAHTRKRIEKCREQYYELFTPYGAALDLRKAVAKTPIEENAGNREAHEQKTYNHLLDIVGEHSHRRLQQFALENLHHLYMIRHAEANNLQAQQYLRRFGGHGTDISRRLLAMALYPHDQQEARTTFTLDLFDQRSDFIPGIEMPAPGFGALNPVQVHALLTHKKKSPPNRLSQTCPFVAQTLKSVIKNEYDGSPNTFHKDMAEPRVAARWLRKICADTTLLNASTLIDICTHLPLNVTVNPSQKMYTPKGKDKLGKSRGNKAFVVQLLTDFYTSNPTREDDAVTFLYACADHTLNNNGIKSLVESRHIRSEAALESDLHKALHSDTNWAMIAHAAAKLNTSQDIHISNDNIAEWLDTHMAITVDALEKTVREDFDEKATVKIVAHLPEALVYDNMIGGAAFKVGYMAWDLTADKAHLKKIMWYHTDVDIAQTWILRKYPVFKDGTVPTQDDSSMKRFKGDWLCHPDHVDDLSAWLNANFEQGNIKMPKAATNNGSALKWPK